MNADKLRDEALALSAEQRAELARTLLESLHEEADLDAEAAWISELDRRAQAVADGTAKLVDETKRANASPPSSRRAVKVVRLAEAEAELDDAAAWYDERSIGLGDELMDAVYQALTVVEEAPDTWPRWPGASTRIPPIRRCVLRRFPYALCVPSDRRHHHGAGYCAR